MIGSSRKLCQSFAFPSCWLVMLFFWLCYAPFPHCEKFLKIPRKFERNFARILESFWKSSKFLPLFDDYGKGWCPHLSKIYLLPTFLDGRRSLIKNPSLLQNSTSFKPVVTEKAKNIMTALVIREFWPTLSDKNRIFRLPPPSFNRFFFLLFQSFFSPFRLFNPPPHPHLGHQQDWGGGGSTEN